MVERLTQFQVLFWKVKVLRQRENGRFYFIVDCVKVMIKLVNLSLTIRLSLLDNY